MRLQIHLNKLQNWLELWRIKINTNKSVYVTFTLRPDTNPPVEINNSIILHGNVVRFLGNNFDKKFKIWAHHKKFKRTAFSRRVNHLRPFLKSKNLPLNTKHLIYKQLIRPIMTYDIQFWGAAKTSNTKIFSLSNL